MSYILAVGRVIKGKGAEITMTHHEKWYNRRLAKYFVEHYEQYEDVAEYWNDPDINQWLFDIPDLGIRVELTCDDKGNVHEQKYYLKD